MKKPILVIACIVYIFLSSDQAFSITKQSNNGIIITFILMNYSEIIYDIRKGNGDYLESLINELKFEDKVVLKENIQNYSSKYKDSFMFAQSLVRDFN
jgi:hypothetical protein